jgi:ubiquinone/menaquinone biosynthesis C-methylase UbiE
VLKPGGALALLELSLPDARWAGALFRALLGALPLVDRAVGAGGSLTHLRREILGWRGRAAVGELLARAGFEAHRATPLSGGVTTLHVARRAR